MHMHTNIYTMYVYVSYLLFVVSPCNSPNVCVSGETRKISIHISRTSKILEKCSRLCLEENWWKVAKWMQEHF